MSAQQGWNYIISTIVTRSPAQVTIERLFYI